MGIFVACHACSAGMLGWNVKGVTNVKGVRNLFLTDRWMCTYKAGMLGRQEMGMVRRVADLTALAVFFASCCHVSILPIAGAGTRR